MGDIRTTEFDLEISISDNDDLLANISGGTARIPFKNIKSILSAWSNIISKPFDALDNTYLIAKQDGQSAILTLSDDTIATLNNVGVFASDIQALQDTSHTHDNRATIDKFGTNSEGKLTWDSVTVGSDYTLPVATDSTLGGVKIDGDTIKMNDGVISADVIGNWSAGVSYPVGYFVVYDGNLYQCINANSDTEWTESNWTPIGSAEGIGINNWSANTLYKVGDLVINGVSIYQCNTEHTSGETFDETELANWTALTGAKGDKGDDGISPVANVVSTETGATITITDATETTTVNINNGTNGITPHIDETTKHWTVGETDTGVLAEGINGISPTATVEQTETGATITITDGIGTSSANILNGINGNDGLTPHIDETTKHWFVGETDTGIGATINIDDTSTDGTDVTWSASKINSVIGDINTVLASVTGGI